MRRCQVAVAFEYKLHGSAEWKTLKLSPEDYFDLRVMDPDEPLDIHCVSEHLDPREFLSEDPSVIQHIKIRISDAEQQYEETEGFTYWNRGKCLAIERQSNVPGHGAWELVLQVVLCDPPRTVATIKMGRKDGALVATEHSVMVDEEGTEWLPDDERPNLWDFMNPRKE